MRKKLAEYVAGLGVDDADVEILDEQDYGYVGVVSADYSPGQAEIQGVLLLLVGRGGGCEEALGLAGAAELSQGRSQRKP